MIEVLSAALLASMPVLNPEELPAYPGVALTRIGEQLVVDGMAQRLAYFVAPDSLDAVALYFLREWSVEGQLFVHDSRSAEELRKHSHRTLLLNAGLARARHSVIGRLTAIGCRVVEDGTASIDFRCPVGQVRILLIAQSPELTAVLETKLETGDPRHREQEW